MAVPPEVRAGDLITADFMNSVLAELADLRAEIVLLQGSGTSGTGLAVLSYSPVGTATDPIRVGSELRVHGREFRYAIGAHRVSIDGAPINTFKAGSNDSLLIFDVPSLPIFVPTGGRPATLRVGNGLASVDVTITVRPADLPIMGTVEVIWRNDIANPVPNPIAANGPASFMYSIHSGATRDASFALSVATVPPSFQSFAHVTDSSGVPIPGNIIPLEQGATKNIVVRIDLPAGSNGQTFSLNVSAASGSVLGADSRVMTIGALAEPEDPTLDLGSADITFLDPTTGAPPAGATYTSSTNTITLPAGAMASVEFDALFGTPGIYEIAIEAAAGSSGWTLTKTPTQHTEGTTHHPESLQFTLQPSATATTPSEVTYRVQRQGASAGQVRRFHVVRI